MSQKLLPIRDSSSKSSDLRLVVISNGVAILPCETPESSTGVQYNWSKGYVPVVTRSDGELELPTKAILCSRTQGRR
ncbi:hypothetical protein CEXT_765671 [Caerostris extrusa]|uniref:Ig-like domain-containing protein n=1 Tax=Caerostris extrusa TaxID=172846 RepID=A0AAV4R8T1_CAEEX|nr:hypothetical protein CEXT_765671 [Caerostris extrusa]